MSRVRARDKDPWVESTQGKAIPEMGLRPLDLTLGRRDPLAGEDPHGFVSYRSCVRLLWGLGKYLHVPGTVCHG